LIQQFGLFSLYGILAIALGAEPGLAEPRVRRNVEVEFETIEGASLYEIQIKRKDDRNGKWQQYKSNTPQWSANVKPGMYLMRTRAYDDRGAPGDWSQPADLKVRLPAIIVNSPGPGEVLKSADPAHADVKLSWEEIPGATGYRLTLKTSDGQVLVEQNVKEAEWNGRIPAGHQISWNAVAIDNNGEDGEVSSEPYQFQLIGPALDKVKIEKPYSRFVQVVTWSKSEYAGRYSYTLSRYNPTSKTWDQVEKIENLKDTKAVLDIKQPTGRYRLAVTALGAYREDSPTAQIEYFAEGGFKNQEEFDKATLRDGITKPTKYYFIASYLFTQINYAGRHYESNSTPTFKATGGTGRVGVGYQPPRRNWGGFAIADYSGFVIQGTNYRFASAELHVTRKMEFGQGALVQFGTGLFSKELPIVTGTPVEGWQGLGKVRSNGPHIGFTYWQPVKSRFGLQLNGRVYYGLIGKGGGQDIEPALSYQYGLLGSYRLDKNTTGYAGYAYRKDEAKFGATSSPDNFALPGATNSVSIDGHYINLILEFSF
jgi:hypothetical protein